VIESDIGLTDENQAIDIGLIDQSFINEL